MITYPYTFEHLGYTIEINIPAIVDGQNRATITVTGIPDKPYLKWVFVLSWGKNDAQQSLTLICQASSFYDAKEIPLFTERYLVDNSKGDFTKFFAIRMDGQEQYQQVCNAFLKELGNLGSFNREWLNYLQEEGLPNPFGYRMISFVPKTTNIKGEWLSSITNPLTISVEGTDETAALNDGSIAITVDTIHSGKNAEFKIVDQEENVVRDYLDSLAETGLSAGTYTVIPQYSDAYYLPDGLGGILKLKGIPQTITIAPYVSE